MGPQAWGAEDAIHSQPRGVLPEPRSVVELNEPSFKGFSHSSYYEISKASFPNIS